MHRMHSITDTLATFNRQVKAKTLALAIAAVFSQAVLANPVGPSVGSGSATFATSGNTLTVTNSPNAVINWQQFNIGQNETTRFVQQSAQSSVLNRIGGQNASQIMGTLQSNGKVFLINPNGILFGAGSVIDVAGLVASSLNLSDANFLANKLIFDGGGFGAVSNLGTISTPLGGSVYLIGSNVSNQGVITSPQGQILLAAGSSVSLIDSAGPELSVTLTANGNKAVNLGTVTAAGGRIDMFGAIIEQVGVLRADSASIDAAGNIVLKATQSTTVSGEISATNSVGGGGKVQVLGDQVALTSTAKIDVSGVGAGGTALIGGDYQGDNAAVQNAAQTSIAAGATIKADALGSGNGGRVIVWADDKTVFDGFISARGGANGGDGGFVETSGHNSLQVSGRVDTLAPKGKTGNWLLDPASYCFEDSIVLCSAAVNVTTANVATALNSSDITYSATDFLFIKSLDLVTGGFTRSGANLTFVAPHIDQTGSISAASGSIGLNLTMQATGSSTTYPGLSGKIYSQGNIALGNSSSAFNLRMKADSEIRFFSTTSINAGTVSTGSSSIGLSSPLITLSGTTSFYSGAIANWSSGGLYIETNKVAGSFQGTVAKLGIKTYSAGFNIYLGKYSTDAECGVSGLCLTQQFDGGSLSSGEGFIFAGNSTAGDKINEWEPSNMTADGNIFIGGYGAPFNFASQNLLGIIGRNITINSGASISGADWASSTEANPLALFATQTFTNLGNGVVSMPAGKYWAVGVGNYAGSSFGAMATGASVIKLSGFSQLDGDISSSTGWTRGWPSTNIIVDFGASSTLCQTNPTACLVPDITKTIDQNQTVSATDLNTIGTTTQGLATFSTDLKIVAKDSDKKAEDLGSKTVSSAKGELTVAGNGKGDDKKKKDEVKRERQETRTAEERKSPIELKREAQQARAEAKKLDGEAKKTAAEGKKAEAEAKKAEGEQKKAEAEQQRADVVAKKAEESGKKAEAEARQYDGEAKQAANEAKSAKSVDAKIAAEARKAEAEGKKADAEGRKTEAESKTVVAEGKKLEVEHKRADSEAKHTEAEHKRVESESKQAESSSKQAEAEHKLAVAEAKEAKTPQQKAVAEKRADEKRIEAIQEKAKAEVKKEHADVKKAEVEAKKAESEQKKTESDSKKVEAEAKLAEVDSRKSESQAKKAEADAKRAEVDSVKAKQEGKGGDEKKAETRKADAGKKQIEQEKKAVVKKVEAEKKQAEADGKKREAEQKKAQAEEKRLVAEKKQAERREREVKSFAKASMAAMAPEKLAELIAMRHEYKTESFKPALNILERNPAAANLPACGSGGGDVCAPAKATAQQVAQQIGQIPAPRIPKVSFLPQIERKIAIVVAINNYKDRGIPSLESAVPDGDAVGNLMQDKLGYDVRVIRDAGKADIVKALNAVGREVGPNDSVAVYYAGHGYQMDGKSGGPGEGYWIPADGSSREPSNWISNSDVSRLLANIPAKQVMLVSDSCYSGAFTKEQKITAPVSVDPAQILAKRSVVVMSSGGEEPVSDEGKEGHSIFAWSLMNSMKNVDKFDTGSKLYEGVRKQVIEEFPQVPQYGAATSAGHVQGGDYLFEARRY